MKKIILLLSILCAGVLNGMEQPGPELDHYIGIGMDALPDDVIPIIITYLNQYDSDTYKYDRVNEIIYAIKAISLTNKNLNKIINDMYGNPEAFKALIHMIRNKTGRSTEEIANKFNTPAAKKYLNLVKQATHLNEDYVNQINLLIKDGLDVNFSYEWLQTKLLKEVIHYLEPGIIEAFLNAGAKVEDKWELEDMLKYIDALTATSPSLKVYKIKDLLKNALKKQQ